MRSKALIDAVRTNVSSGASDEFQAAIFAGASLCRRTSFRALREAVEACPNRGGVQERAGRIITKVHPLNPPLFPRSRATFERPRDGPSRDVDKRTEL